MFPGSGPGIFEPFYTAKNDVGTGKFILFPRIGAATVDLFKKVRIRDTVSTFLPNRSDPKS
jgi:hypothetical protein